MTAPAFRNLQLFEQMFILEEVVVYLPIGCAINLVSSIGRNEDYFGQLSAECGGPITETISTLIAKNGKPKDCKKISGVQSSDTSDSNKLVWFWRRLYERDFGVVSCSLKSVIRSEAHRFQKRSQRRKKKKPKLNMSVVVENAKKTRNQTSFWKENYVKELNRLESIMISKVACTKDSQDKPNDATVKLYVWKDSNGCSMTTTQICELASKAKDDKWWGEDQILILAPHTIKLDKFMFENFNKWASGFRKVDITSSDCDKSACDLSKIDFFMNQCDMLTIIKPPQRYNLEEKSNGDHNNVLKTYQCRWMTKGANESCETNKFCKQQVKDGDDDCEDAELVAESFTNWDENHRDGSDYNVGSRMKYYQPIIGHTLFLSMTCHEVDIVSVGEYLETGCKGSKFEKFAICTATRMQEKEEYLGLDHQKEMMRYEDEAARKAGFYSWGIDENEPDLYWYGGEMDYEEIVYSNVWLMDRFVDVEKIVNALAESKSPTGGTKPRMRAKLIITNEYGNGFKFVVQVQ